MSDYIFDIETFPNCFTVTFIEAEGDGQWVYEISDRINEGLAIMSYLQCIHDGGHRLVGFNCINFDYPVLHELITRGGNVDAPFLYQKAVSIITTSDFDKFTHVIWDNQRFVTLVDLFKIHHFDNKARATSLKTIEFNMHSPMIQDLPFEPGTILTHEQMNVLREYNMHDVLETRKFYKYTIPAIRFREQLSEKYNRNFINHNDTKIGKDYLIMKLEEAGVRCFTDDRKPIQTHRKKIPLSEAVFPWIEFISPEFQRIKEWFKAQVITETNGVFKDVSATVKGFQFDFGLGGIHGSINNTIVRSNDEYQILDLDVTSYYPSLGIVNRIYPKHLTEKFCDIYADVMEQRKQYKKGTPENAALKLALNGAYGDSNNIYSCFYDPLYTMTITINGQLLLCMLAEHLLQIPDLKLIQVNTDGVTVKVKRDHLPMVNFITDSWCKFTKLKLESSTYKSMFIRDVNNYLAVKDDGKVKRKGEFTHVFNPESIDIGQGDLDWTRDHSARIIPQAVEHYLTNGLMTVEELILNHNNLYDYCLRAKVPRGSSLVLFDPMWGDFRLQNITRYYVSQGGPAGTSGNLVKIMPPLKGKTEPRRIGINVGWTVTPCNSIMSATNPIDYNFYIQEAKKLIDPLKEEQS